MNDLRAQLAAVANEVNSAPLLVRPYLRPLLALLTSIVTALEERNDGR